LCPDLSYIRQQKHAHRLCTPPGRDVPTTVTSMRTPLVTKGRGGGGEVILVPSVFMPDFRPDLTPCVGFTVIVLFIVWEGHARPVVYGGCVVHSLGGTCATLQIAFLRRSSSWPCPTLQCTFRYPWPLVLPLSGTCERCHAPRRHGMIVVYITEGCIETVIKRRQADNGGPSPCGSDHPVCQ